MLMLIYEAVCSPLRKADEGKRNQMLVRLWDSVVSFQPLVGNT